MMVPKSSPWKLTERALALGLVLFLCAVVAVPLARGQAQANSPEAAFFLGTDPGSGASWPRAQAIAQGFTTTVSVRGGVRQAFLLGSQDRLKASPSRVLGGQWLHLDARGFFDVFASYGEPFAVLDASGRFDLSVLPGARPRGSGIGLQALVTDPTAAPGFTLSGATQVRYVERIDLNLFNNGSLRMDFAALGLPDFPFYGNVESSLWVNTNGNLTFQQGNTDFTPTPNEFHRGTPIIAPRWMDLDPARGGDVRVISRVGAGPNGAASMRVEWDRIPVWQSNGTRHSFAAELDFDDGGLRLEHPAGSLPAIYDSFTGISPGRSQSIQPGGVFPAYTDFTTLSGVANAKTGAADESFWEWHGEFTMVYYTQSFSNVYDLTGTTIRFEPLGAGSPGAAYRVYTD